MNRLIAIDPGRQGLAWAIFERKELIAAGLLVDLPCLEKAISVLMALNGLWVPAAAVIEVPQVYQQRLWKGDPNDLIDVAVIAGAAAACFPSAAIQLVRPHAWKGSRPKAADNKLTLSLLTKAERSLLEDIKPKSKLHNVLDAVGIGLWALKRR